MKSLEEIVNSNDREAFLKETGMTMEEADSLLRKILLEEIAKVYDEERNALDGEISPEKN